MGFSLHFMRMTKDVQLDVDRAAVAAFLDQHGLRVVESPYGGEIVDRDDRALTIDGAFSDLHLDSLEQSDPLSGGIFHATLSPAECAFVYDLCAAAGFLIVNPQGDPTFLVPQRNHEPDDVSELEDVVWVESAEELARALTGGFQAFREFRDRVTGRAAGAE
ncbi:hypothetical protein EEB12_17030 [Rhodococcus sp. WS1]|jgi:hypothetical protein|uniref:Uncharacterized protein n=2 Tax=Rhodococcus erythropolis TaxID=1833 RepID=A0A0C3A349_RHOER|nr:MULTISPECIES: hypothetical protein [Rhodococcus]AGT95266.1 tRNA(5-methylaminomethyl-2-thiouridylate) methyltransferase [Rhodococcus erythropolis CCM2595]KAB2584993.1 hypothetical protein BS297_12675 [Rhodococcus erythropolis]KIM14664.1 tRNA(5-methylaminomethyl-2-thiouridylate) methyltransferase [Rhodococcus erythropolis]MBO8144693.1 hypothetical protein [Rhodococcus erythropolis]MBT1254386.1 hypothetical protein [Rhodococcus erythropolis]